MTIRPNLVQLVGMQMEPGGRLVMMVMSDRNSEEGWQGPRRTSEAEIRHNLRECALPRGPCHAVGSIRLWRVCDTVQHQLQVSAVQHVSALPFQHLVAVKFGLHVITCVFGAMSTSGSCFRIWAGWLLLRKVRQA